MDQIRSTRKMRIRKIEKQKKNLKRAKIAGVARQAALLQESLWRRTLMQAVIFIK